MKLSIREFSINFSKKLREESSRIERELETRLWELEKEGHLLSDPELQEEFHMIKRELFQMQLLQARESMTRTRVKWDGEGERPSKFFLNLEKKNYDSKTMTELFDKDGSIITDPEEILHFEKSHFSARFGPVTPISAPLQRGLEDLFLTPAIHPVSDLDKQVLNSDISLEEMEEAVHRMKNGKAPGCDGFPTEFYKKFWGSQ